MNHYPNGFIFSPSGSCVPQQFQAGPIAGLYLSPDTTVSAAIEGDDAIIIIGVCVKLSSGSEAPARYLMSALSRSYEDFLCASDDLCGRYAIVLVSDNIIKIFSDATGMRSVFYEIEFGIIASHASMITKEDAGSIHFRYGYPGNATPYSDVKLLTPNTCINLTHRKIERFWPRQLIGKQGIEAVVDNVSWWVCNAIKNISKNRRIRMALTAGLDSRATLALMIQSGVPFETYTYGGGNDTAIDIKVASDLAEKCGLRHTVIKARKADEELQAAIGKATYATHHHTAIAPLREWFGDPKIVAVTANLLETGRAFYSKMSNPHPPITARTMRELHIRSMPRSSRELVGCGEFVLTHYDQAFSSFIESSKFEEARKYNLDSFDQFYWEHRMGAWHGVNMNERDFYAEAFIPFNSRKIFESLLSVNLEDRKKARVFELIIESQGIGNEFMPINPKEYP